jgi:hypothetical protein
MKREGGEIRDEQCRRISTLSAAGGVEGATMDYTKLTLAQLRNGISDTKSAIHRCKEALDNLRQPKTVGLQAMADAITHLLPRLEQDLKALEKAYIAKSVSRGQK